LANAKLVMIIRHGEKLNDKVTNLSEKGQARASCLVDVFGSNGVYATPQKIFAQSPSEKKQSTRPRDTVIPLAKSLGLEVDLSYTSGKVKNLVSDIVSSPEDVFLISWSNDKISEIANSFNINQAPKWDGDNFDDIWVISDGKIPYIKKVGVNVTPSSTFNGNGDLNMVIVKENVDDCINRIIDAINNGGLFPTEGSSDNSNNSNYFGQNSQGSYSYNSTLSQEVIEQANLDDNNIASNSKNLKTSFISIVTIVGMVLALFY